MTGLLHRLAAALESAAAWWRARDELELPPPLPPERTREQLGFSQLVLPFTPPPERVPSIWRPRISARIQATMRERVAVYYAAADLPVVNVLALAGWPVDGAR